MRIMDWSSDVCSSDLGGIWQQVHELDGLAAFADAERRKGFAGTTILHPSNAPIVNRAFSPGPEQLAQYRAMKIGSASCRERVWQDVSNPVGGVPLHKTKQ